MIFESAIAIEISLYTFQSRLKLDGVFHLYPVDSLSQTERQRFTIQRQFQQIKKVMLYPRWNHVPWLAILNDVASMDNRLLSKNSTHQTIRAHTEKELFRKIAANRHIVVRIV